MRRGLFALLAVSALMVCCTSCSPPPPAMEGPYAAEYARAIEESDSEFVKAILSDGVIEETEFLEAVSQTNVCLGGTGTGVTFVYYGDVASYGWLYPDDQYVLEREEAVNQCNQDWLGEIAELFTGALKNPNNEDREDLFAACLVRHGIAPEGFTGDIYEELNYRPEYGFSYTQDEKTGEVIYTPPLVEQPQGVALPDGSIVSNDDPEVSGCNTWPMR